MAAAASERLADVPRGRARRVAADRLPHLPPDAAPGTPGVVLHGDQPGQGRPPEAPAARGRYVPTGNRPAGGQEQESCSGKHRVQRLSVQVAATGSGELVAVSDPVPGSRHDPKALSPCGWTQILDTPGTHRITDTAYAATNALTPIKKTPGRKRLDRERAFNKSVAPLRPPVEHAISHLKNRKILAPDYRYRLQELPLVI